MKRACGDCAWWNPDEAKKWGNCRVRAPIVIALSRGSHATHFVVLRSTSDAVAPSFETRGSFETVWPLTTSYEWCGEFERVEVKR